MKLYTEEQMRVVYNLGFSDSNNNFGRKEDETINFFTPIELPSDEEIEKETRVYANISSTLVIDKEERYYKDFQKYDGYKAGAKWMKEQILNQNK